MVSIGDRSCPIRDAALERYHPTTRRHPAAEPSWQQQASSRIFARSSPNGRRGEPSLIPLSPKFTFWDTTLLPRGTFFGSGPPVRSRTPQGRFPPARLLQPEVGLQVLLQAVVGIDGGGENHQAALRRVARAATESDLDTASAIFNPELLGPLRGYKPILDLLARKSPTRTLRGLTPEAVGAAQHEDPLTMEVLCAIAGLSFRDLKERVGE